MRISATRSIMTRLPRSRVISARRPTASCYRRDYHDDQHKPPRPQQQQDETLLWASQHRALAQACLEIPPTSPTESTTCPMPLHQSLEDYLAWRQWEIPPSVDHHAKMPYLPHHPPSFGRHPCDIRIPGNNFNDHIRSAETPAFHTKKCNE